MGHSSADQSAHDEGAPHAAAVMSMMLVAPAPREAVAAVMARVAMPSVAPMATPVMRLRRQGGCQCERGGQDGQGQGRCKEAHAELRWGSNSTQGPRARLTARPQEDALGYSGPCLLTDMRFTPATMVMS